MNMSLKEFAIECYGFSNKQLFTMCLKLYEEILAFPKPIKKELETLRTSVTFEVDADDNGFLKSQPTYDFYLQHLKNDVPNAVAIISEFPEELGLYTWEIVTVDERIIEHKLVKAWIVPTPYES